MNSPWSRQIKGIVARVVRLTGTARADRFGGCALILMASVLCLKPVACQRSPKPNSGDPVVLYTSIDEPFARTIMDDYERQTGQPVRVVFDAEAGKTTGLVNRIRQEAGRPRADVFWSSEPFNTILLGREGLLAEYDARTAHDLPDSHRSPQHLWTATSLRARVIAFQPGAVGELRIPQRWEELADPDVAPHVAFANPLFGTTRGHVAAMFLTWGEERGRRFLQGLRDRGALMVDGNSAAVRAVLDGRAKFAATDSDDVWLARRSGAELEAKPLDMGDGAAMFIPCSVAVLRGAPNPRAAERLVEFLVSEAVERKLAESDARFIPARERLCREMNIVGPVAAGQTYGSIAAEMDRAMQVVREILIR